MLEHLPSMHEDLGLIPHLKKKKLEEFNLNSW
jgi:hypothetical protein